MRRRDFIAALGSASALWPVAARAQQPSMPVIGYLGTGTPSTQREWLETFTQRLHELGWREGQNLKIEVRFGEGRNERFAEIAAEFAALKVNMIVSSGGAVPAIMRTTSTIPTIFAGANDPVGSGYVTSLARPGGNVTGLSLQSADLVGKRLELLREVAPKLKHLAVIGSARDSRGSVVGKSTRSRRRLERRISRWRPLKSTVRRTSRPPLMHSRAGPRRCTSSATRSQPRIESASSLWRLGPACRRCSASRIWSKRAV